MSDALFSSLVAAPADPILGVTQRYRQDPRPQKVNLGVGAYMTDEGVTPVLDVVKEAETALAEACIPHSYLPISGLDGYGAHVQQMVFGADSEIVLSGRAATIQTLGGTGALKVGMDFMFHICGERVASTSLPTWGNHNAILGMAGYEIKPYRYYDASTNSLNFDAMVEDLKALPAKTLVVLHSCCHNPTGYDLNEEQWKVVIEICQKGGLTPFLDMAYQGFRNGLDEDATAIRMFAASGMSFLVATSFSKSFNLYNERIGALTVVCQSKTEADIVMTQLKAVVRCNYSNPPAHGAYIVERVLSGETIAFASDAGMPSVSDPGQLLVDAAREAGAPVEVIPGPSACVTALVSSGISCDHFFFEGFLPRKQGERVRRLQELAAVPGALLFYESPHRAAASLDAIATVFPQTSSLATTRSRNTRKPAIIRALSAADMPTASAAQHFPLTAKHIHWKRMTGKTPCTVVLPASLTACGA